MQRNRQTEYDNQHRICPQDVLETNLLEMQQQYKKEGFELRHDSKRKLQHSHSRDKEIEK